MTHLAVEDVSVDFGGIHALRDVTFGLETGAIVGLIGPNGAGKSTLLNCISGITRPTRGRVRLMPAERSLDVVGALVCGAVFGPCLTGRGGSPENRVQDVLDVVFNGIPSDATPAATGCRVPSARPTSAASEGPPPQ